MSVYSTRFVSSLCTMNKVQLKDLPQFKKPREKIAEKGPPALSEVELLATILGVGRQGRDALTQAKRILATYSLAELSTMPVAQLQLLEGIGFAQACRLCASFYLGKIASEKSVPMTVSKPKVVFQLAQDIAHKHQEHLLGIYLDGRHRLINKKILSIGTLTSSLLHPREVFAPAIKYRAAAVIIAHNHPSGDVNPSEEDIQATDKLIEGGEILDIPLVDHVIVTADKWFSFREMKLL